MKSRSFLANILVYIKKDTIFVSFFTKSILIVCTAYASIYVAIHHVSRGWLHGAFIVTIYIVLIMIFGSVIVPNFVLSRFVMYRILICLVTGLVGGNDWSKY
ncbi:MAG: TIGR04086 family membrane protein [Clostridiales bacterium]|nr:TIGR04086 family membrane protein [Clostridiales bacterium]